MTTTITGAISRARGFTAQQSMAIAQTRQAVLDGRVKFMWESDQDPDNSWMDDDDLAHLASGDIEVLTCTAYLPKHCGHCGHEVEGEWDWADSLGGVVVTGESDPYCRLIESEFAEGHLV